MNYVKIERSDAAGSYIEDAKGVRTAMDGELDDLQYLAPGTTITLTVVKMTPEEYEALPEFEGW